MDNHSEKWDLVADIGGTNMRLAQVMDGQLISQSRYSTKCEAPIEAIFADFVNKIGSAPHHIEIAAAGVIGPHGVEMTNSGRSFGTDQLQTATNCSSVRILNDFEAAAWSLMSLAADDLTALQGPSPVIGTPLPHGNRVIIGPGTGLGVGALVWAGDQPCVIKGEGGHCRLAPENAEELEIFSALIKIWPEVQMGEGLAVEAEALVSGTGLPRLLEALELVHGQAPSLFQSGDIFAKAKADPASIARKAVDLFCKGLGNVAGDLALTLSAHGGVFLSGGVAQANPWIFDSPVFLDAFNAGGRLGNLRRSFPIYLTHNENFGLIGAINAMQFAPMKA